VGDEQLAGRWCYFHDQDDLSSQTYGFTPGLSRFGRAETRICGALPAWHASASSRSATGVNGYDSYASPQCQYSPASS
jgi:hypothetical protein